MPSCDSRSGDPELRVSPSSLTIDELDDEAVVTVLNVGRAELEWSALSQTEWITLVAPDGGHIAAGGSQDVMLEFDANRMAFGTTTGEVRFSATGRMPTWSITVTSEVNCPGAVVQPTTGVIWGEGETREISWEGGGAGRVRLELVVGTESAPIAADELNDGSFSWIVNADGLADLLCAEDFRIRVAPLGRQECDRLSEPFCIRPTACTAPPAPACAPSPGHLVVDVAPSTDLAWSCGDSPCDRAVEYRVYFGGNPSPGANELVGTTPNKTWDLPELAPDTRYYWKIVAQDENGITSSPVWEFATAAAPCIAPPVAVCAPGPVDGSSDAPLDANLSWSCGDSECALPVTYRVYFGTGPAPTLDLVGSTSEKSWDLPDLAPSTLHSWRIDAEDTNGTTTGPVWTFTTGPGPCVALPTAPCTPLPGSGAGDVSIDPDLAWGCGDSQCALPVTYTVFFGTDPDPTQSAGIVSSPSFDLPQLVFATHYYWRVTAEDANGTTSGPVWDFTTAVAPCTTPPTPACTPSPALDAGGVAIDANLAWGCGDSPCALPVTYLVYFGTSPNPTQLAGSVSSRSFDLPQLAYETHYFWRVDAQDANGTTSGPIWGFTTVDAPCVASPVAACSPSPAADADDVSRETDLAWSCGDSQCGLAVTYHVYFGTDSDPDSGELVGSTANKSWTLPRLAEGRQYFWRVDAEDANGVTTGTVWSFTTAAPPCTSPPTSVCTPSPAHHANDVSLDADLSWGCGESECFGVVLYHVYFGTDDHPDAGELQGTTPFKFWVLPELDEDTKYFWRIIAEDANGTRQGPVWEFETVKDAARRAPSSSSSR